MAILINKPTRVIVQGMSGRIGQFHAADMIRHGTCVVGGVTPGRGGETVLDRPLFDTVRAAVAAGLLLKGGGHAMAAGLTVSRDRFAAMQAFLRAEVEKAGAAGLDTAALEIDGALTPGAVSDGLMELIERAGPYGQGNPQPRFAFPAHRVKFAKIAGETHVRCVLEAGDGSRLDAIAFRAAGQPLGDLILNSGGLPIHVAGHVRRDTWGGRDRLELQIDDAADPRARG